MKLQQFFKLLEETGDSILAGVAGANMFALRLLARASQPMIAIGLMYWVATNLMNPYAHPLSWWSIAWAITQAVAITAHLATLPGRAIEQAHAGERAELILTVIALVGLSISTLTFLDALNNLTITSIRTLTLISLLFTEPVAQPPMQNQSCIIPAGNPDEEQSYQTYNRD